MGKTKDYEDYIDYTFDHGLDPADFDSYDDYVDAVLSEMPPVNYNLWERESKQLLQSELTDFFIGYKKPIGGSGGVKEPPEGDIIEDKKVQRAKVVGKAIRWQTKRSEGKVPKTTKTQAKTIEKKIVEGKKFTKAEWKTVRSARMKRSWELQKEFGYSKSEAMKRAHQEFRW